MPGRRLAGGRLIGDPGASRMVVRAVQWLADYSLVDDDAASHFLASHPDPDLP